MHSDLSIKDSNSNVSTFLAVEGDQVGPLMEGSDSTVSIERALELTGYGKYTILLTLACGLCLCGATAEIYTIGFVLPAAECDLNLDTSSKSLLAGACLIGMIIGANIWGFLSDRYGRKKIIIYSGSGGVFCSVMAMLSHSFWAFTIFRCLVGAFVTGALSTIFAYSGEFLPQKYRSKSIVFIGVLQNFYSIFIPTLAWILLPLDYSITIFNYKFNSWRIFLLLNTLPLLFGTLSVSFFPESPKYLLSTGDLDSTIQVLKKIYVGNNGKDDYKVKKIFAEENDDKKLTNKSFLVVLTEQFSCLFKKKYIFDVVSTSFLQFCNFAVSSGLLIWYADILNIQNNDDSNVTVCEAIQSGIKNVTINCNEEKNEFNTSMFTQNLWIGVMYLSGQLIIILALKYLRKTFIQGLFTLTAGICATIMIFVTSPLLINILFVLFLVLPGLCVVVVSAIVVDIFPTHLRSSAVSFSLTMGRISSLISTSTIGHIIQLNCYIAFSIYATLLISSSVVATLMRSKEKRNCDKNVK
ncbi:synaptic vesicle glycoprotein 2C-like isoform X1 [Onthophagus taurus]|uniref:synaptic vesicle glycoprotein 2C-like isoform X1 n=1 Tax=Onthophagus taurus TaxID=166361 RepID=UPI0039BE8A33